MHFTVYSDFTCAECYGVNETLVSLGLSGDDAVRWRGVQHEPTLAVPMRPLERRALNDIDDAIADVQRKMPGVIMHLPKGKPNTHRAIVALASVMRQMPSRAAAYRDALFRGYWRDGADISLMAELQRIADGAGVPRMVSLDHPDADEAVDDWDLDWATERLGGVPRVIRADGRILWGLKSADEMKSFFQV